MEPGADVSILTGGSAFLINRQDVRSVMRLAVEEEAGRMAAEQQVQQQGKASSSSTKGVPVTGTVVKAAKGPGTARCVFVTCVWVSRGVAWHGR